MFCGVAILFNGAPCGFLGEQEAVIKPKSTKGHVTFWAILSYRQVVFVFRYHIVVLRCNQTQIINQMSCHHPFVFIFSSSSCRHQPSYSVVISLFFLSCRNHSLLNNQRFQNIFIFLKSERPSAWTRPLSVPDSISWLISWRWLSASLDLDQQIPHFVNILQLAEQFFCGSAIFGAMGPTFCSPIGDLLPRAPEADLQLPNQLNSAPNALSQRAHHVSHWRREKKRHLKDGCDTVRGATAGIGWVRYLWVGWGI